MSLKRRPLRWGHEHVAAAHIDLVGKFECDRFALAGRFEFAFERHDAAHGRRLARRQRDDRVADANFAFHDLARQSRGM